MSLNYFLFELFLPLLGQNFPKTGHAIIIKMLLCIYCFKTKVSMNKHIQH